MGGKSFTFDWHADETSEFLKFLWISLMAEGDHAELMTKTDKGFNIQLQVFANGVEVSAQHMIESLEQNFDHAVSQKAAELITKLRLTELEDTIQTVESQIRQTVLDKFEEIGITVRPEDY